MANIGYIRVSTKKQKTDRQFDGLKAFCEQVYFEKASSAGKRPIFEKVLASLRPRDCLVVWDIDRAFRNAEDALHQTRLLQARKISIRFVNFQLDPATAHGWMIYTVLCAVYEYERYELIRRTCEGLHAARKRGAKLGRPRKLSLAKLKAARKQVRRGLDLKDVAARLGVSRWTLSRNLRRIAKERKPHH